MSDNKIVFRGKVVNLRHQRVTLPNDASVELEIVDHPGGAAIVAVNSANQVCLLRQYRYIAGGYIWELPAGRIDNQEPSICTAQRELAEETGTAAQLWMSLGPFLSSPGVFNETIQLWLAQGLTEIESNPDFDEVLEVHWVEFGQAMNWAADGTIIDGKTMAGLVRAQRLLALP